MSKLLLLLAFTSAFMVLSASAGKYSINTFNPQSTESVSGNVVCYFASWTIYRPDNGKFTALDVDPNLCTHILYAFVGLREDGTVSVFGRLGNSLVLGNINKDFINAIVNRDACR
jgi:GH18 family chitinase